MAVLCLTFGASSRKVQANLCFKEALRLGLTDAELLEELGDLYQREDSTINKAVLAYETLVKVKPSSGEAWQKLGDTLSATSPGHAIDCYKRAIERIDGEGNR
jgi:tetratricopeptide (TPR) repeat protein